MTTQELQVFGFEGQEVRVKIIDGEPWWVLRDVCETLGLQAPHMVAARLEEDERSQVSVIDSMGRSQETKIINEAGLYSVIIRSDKPGAKAFKRWITHEVLPKIRKTGGYIAPQVDLTDPDQWQAILDQWKADRARLEESNRKLAIAAPKAEFYDTVVDSKDAMNMNEAAKVLDFVDMGRNKLFEYLRAKKVFDQHNIPYQRFVDAGMFRVIESSYSVGDTVKISKTTLVRQRGLDYISKILIGDGYTRRK